MERMSMLKELRHRPRETDDAITLLLGCAVLM